MSQKLLQSASNAMAHPLSVGSVSVGSMGSGIGAYLEIFSPMVGFMAALAGLTLSILLSVKTYYGIQLARKQINNIGADE